MKKILVILVALFFLSSKEIIAQGHFHCSWANGACSETALKLCDHGYTDSKVLCRSLKTQTECGNAVFDCVWTGQIMPYEQIPGFENFRSIFGYTTEMTLGKIISRLLPYIFVVAGLILFVYLILGGFEFLTSAGNPDSIKKAQDKITNALVGFLLIFIAYWLTQVIEVVFGVKIF